MVQEYARQCDPKEPVRVMRYGVKRVNSRLIYLLMFTQQAAGAYAAVGIE